MENHCAVWRPLQAKQRVDSQSNLFPVQGEYFCCVAASVTERGGARRGPSPTVCMLFFMSCRVSLSLTRLALPRNPTSLAKLTTKTRTSTLPVRSFNSLPSLPTLFSMPERRPFVRLPTDVFPVNYGLRLKPDLVDFTFEGKLEAAVEVTETLCHVHSASITPFGPGRNVTSGSVRTFSVWTLKLLITTLLMLTR